MRFFFFFFFKAVCSTAVTEKNVENMSSHDSRQIDRDRDRPHQTS